MYKIITSAKMIGSDNALYYFKKEIDLKTPANSTINIVAESRYKLYVNGMLAGCGPCKDGGFIKYYDTIDISGYLHAGKNEILINVLQLSSASFEIYYSHLTSVMRRGNLALGVWGTIGGNDFGTDSSWLVAKESDLEFTSPVLSAYVGLSEKRGFAYGRDPQYTNAREVSEIQYAENTAATYVEMNPWYCRKRTIPMLYFREKRFASIENDIYDALSLTTAYPVLEFSGSGSVKITYAESFVFFENGDYVKHNRTDASGIIYGDTDEIEVDGETKFTPFWTRTFRYIKLTFTGDIKLKEAYFIETGYPLEIDDDYDFGNDDNNALFAVSVRTLKRCMYETYEDCPYYEQMQYGMDTYLQHLFTYQLTADDSLQRKAIDDLAMSFHAGMITQSRYPSARPQFIPGFSLFFIFMVYENFRRYNDSTFMKKYLCIIDGNLHWFGENIANGMVKRSNLWDFVDWSEDFVFGMIPGKAPLTVYTLMYAYALSLAAKLNREIGRCDTAAEYENRSEACKTAVKQQCYDKEKNLYSDTPEMKYYTQHSQIWAVLCGLETGENAKSIMERSFTLKSRSTYAYLHYLYMALDMCKMSARKSTAMNELIGLTKLGCTTLPETPTNSRSECHAWSAVPIYEFTAHILGVDVEDASAKTVTIRPQTGDIKHAHGKVATPWGKVSVSWQIDNEVFALNVSVPDGVTANVTLPDGTKSQFTGSASMKCNI